MPRAKKPCPLCRTPINKASKHCTPCSGIVRRLGPQRYFNEATGYVVLTQMHDHPNAHTGRGAEGKIAEHRYVMSEQLGRALLPGEEVHHKNGVKHDNAPDNLELWVVSQPTGQRPCELLAWAYEIVARYEGECSD